MDAASKGAEALSLTTDERSLPGASFASYTRTAWLALLLIVLTVVAYLPALKNGYIWDDDSHLTQNPCVVGPLGLKDIWTSRAARICPLVQTTFWAEHKLWGLAPFPYHLVNILVHGAAAAVLWAVLPELARSRCVAGCGALGPAPDPGRNRRLDHRTKKHTVMSHKYFGDSLFH